MRVIIQEEALRRSEGHYYHHFIHELPTIDAVPVVRCRECKKCRNREPNIGIHWCDHWDNVVRDKDFCSFGERKADGGADT